jgi:hypothetical protein
MEVGTLKIGEIAQTRRALWTDDVASDPRVENKSWVRDERLQSFAGYPLVFRNELVGVLGVFSRRRFTTEAFQLLEVFASKRRPRSRLPGSFRRGSCDGRLPSRMTTCRARSVRNGDSMRLWRESGHPGGSSRGSGGGTD